MTFGRVASKNGCGFHCRKSAIKQNKITSVSGATTPTYDNNGNLTKDENNYRFVYDAWNRQAKIKNASDGVITTNEFDGLNRKFEVTASGVTIDQIFTEGWQVLEEKVSANYKNRYAFSPSYIDALVTRDRDTDANGTLDERQYAQHDANFNVTTITNASRTVQERYIPDPFGAVTFRDASGNTISASAKDWVFLQQGGLAHILGHYDFRNRILSPTLGRWLTNDPLGFDAGDNNFYRYVENGPGNSLDLSGTQERKRLIDRFRDIFRPNPNNEDNQNPTRRFLPRPFFGIGPFPTNNPPGENPLPTPDTFFRHGAVIKW